MGESRTRGIAVAREPVKRREETAPVFGRAIRVAADCLAEFKDFNQRTACGDMQTV